VVVTPILRLGDYDTSIPGELSLLHCEDFRAAANYKKALAKLVASLRQPNPRLGGLLAVGGFFPSPPKHFLARPDLMRRVKEALLVDLQTTQVITGADARVGMQGMGGIGKSVLAAALARDRDVRQSYPDGVVWISFGQNLSVNDLISRQQALAKLLDCTEQFSEIEEGANVLRKLLSTKAVLLVLDDIWRAADSQPFDALGPRCRMLVTTRDRGILHTLHGQLVSVSLFTEVESLRLLADSVDREPDSLPPEARNVVEECGCLPLALALCGGMAKTGHSWKDIVEALREADLEWPEDRERENEQHRTIWAAMKASYDVLDDSEKLRFAELAVFATDQTVPETVVQMLWEHNARISARNCTKLIINLYERSMVQLDQKTNDDGSISRRFRLHDLLYDFASRMAGDLKPLHQTLLDAYRKQCPDGWHAGTNDGYFFDHLARHLAATDNYPELKSLFSDQQWMNARVPNSGYVYHGYISDLELTWEMADKKAVEDETYFADCVRFGLIRTSINSLAANYVPELVVAAVECGLWTLERAIEVTDSIPDKYEVWRLLIMLLQMNLSNTSVRKEIEKKALDAASAIKDEFFQTEALVAVARQMNCPEKVMVLHQALDSARAIETESIRAEKLVTLVEQLNNIESIQLLSEVFEVACSFVHEEYRGVILVSVVGQLNGKEYAEILQQALDVAHFIKEARWRSKILTAVAEQMSAPEKDLVLLQALDAAHAIKEERWRAEALIAIAAQMNSQEKAVVFQQALDAVSTINNEEWRVEILTVISGHLTKLNSSTMLRQTVDIVCALENAGWRARAIASVAVHLGNPENLGLLRQALDAAWSIELARFRVDALISLARL
jgi:hypothetical protein